MSFLGNIMGLKNHKEVLDLDKINKEIKSSTASKSNSTLMGYIDWGSGDAVPKDEINKSFRKGKASNRSTIDEMDHNPKDVNDRSSSITVQDIISRKRALYSYSHNVLVQAIIRTRVNQVLKFCEPARWSSDGVGYKIIPKGNDGGEKLTPKQVKRIKELEDFIYYTGSGFREGRDLFPQFITKFIFNSYIYDQVNIERIFESSHSNKLNHFNSVDASTILLKVNPHSADGTKKYVQYVDNKKIAEFSEKEMIFATYWATADVYSKGYGFSPTEAAMTHLTYHYNTENYNGRFFSQGGMTRGLLVINASGGYQASREALNSIRRAWTPLQGLSGAWKTPMITAQDAKYINMTQNSKDMEFSSWLEYLIKILCAVYNITPEEVNFTSRGTATGRSTGSSINEGSSMKTKMDSSKDKGLTPMLNFIESVINERIMRYVDPDYRFEFTLGDLLTEAQKIDLITKKEKAGMLLNEGRVNMGLDKKDGLDIPGTATEYIQYLNVIAKNDPEANQLLQHSKDYKKFDDSKVAPNIKVTKPEQDVDNSN